MRNGEGMCAALNKPEWLNDERFNTARGRVVNAPARLQATGEVIATRTTAEWLEALECARRALRPGADAPADSYSRTGVGERGDHRV